MQIYKERLRFLQDLGAQRVMAVRAWAKILVLHTEGEALICTGTGLLSISTCVSRPDL